MAKQVDTKTKDTAQGCGCLFVIAIVIWIWAANSCGSRPPSPSAMTPADLRAQRVTAQQYWNRAMTPLALSAACVELAKDSIDSGDELKAQQILITGQKAAQQSYDAALNDEPEGDDWTTIQSDLMGAASGYKDAIGKVSSALDSGSALQAAEAGDTVASARESIDEATHYARKWYVEHGGKNTDIADIDSSTAAAVKLVHLLLSK